MPNHYILFCSTDYILFLCTSQIRWSSFLVVNSASDEFSFAHWCMYDQCSLWVLFASRPSNVVFFLLAIPSSIPALLFSDRIRIRRNGKYKIQSTFCKNSFCHIFSGVKAIFSLEYIYWCLIQFALLTYQKYHAYIFRYNCSGKVSSERMYSSLDNTYKPFYINKKYIFDWKWWHMHICEDKVVLHIHLSLCEGVHLIHIKKINMHSRNGLTNQLNGGKWNLSWGMNE